MIKNLFPFLFRTIMVLSFLFSLESIVFSDEEIPSPSTPVEPVIEELKMPEITTEGPSNQNLSNMLYLFHSSVIFSDGSVLEGTLQLSNNIIFRFTNNINGQLFIKSISLYEIEKIEIVRWMPEKKDNNTFLFIPIEYQLYTNQSDSSYLIYTNNIESFNSFIIGNEKFGYKQLFTIFYDRWMEGKKGVSRWENSKAASFPYNTVHPISGVVRSIQFIKNY